MRIANNRPDIHNVRARYARLAVPSSKPREGQRVPADRFETGKLTPSAVSPVAHVSAGVTSPQLAADVGVSPTMETAAPKRGLADTTSERIVADAYQKLLLRAPDAEGMRTHTELANAALRDGDPPEVVQREIEASIRRSDEYQTIEATQQSFENVLGRRPEERGYWHDQALAMRAQGMSHENIRGELEAAHRRSDEHRLGHPEEVVGEIYRDELMRAPDAAGLRTWTDKAKQLRDEGKSASEIEQTLRGDIGGSDEAQVIDRVNQSFEDVLGRRPEEKGHWHEEALKWRADGMGFDEIDERLRDAHRQSDEYRATHPTPVSPPPSSNDASLSSSAVMDSAQRVAGEINANGGYVFNGVDDCWGFVGRAMNPLLAASGLPKVPVDDYGSAQAARDWKPITDWGQMPVGTPLSTHQGHKWGDDWHGAIFAGVKNGVPYMWDNSSGTGGASLRPVITSGPYALDWMHTPIAAALG